MCGAPGSARRAPSHRPHEDGPPAVLRPHRVVGDYLAPLAEQQAAQIQGRYKGGLKLGRSGAWLKDRQFTPNGERSYSINVGSAGSGGMLHNIRIFEFDSNGSMVQRIAASDGQVDKHSTWTLSDVTVTRWADAVAGQSPLVAVDRKCVGEG